MGLRRRFSFQTRLVATLLFVVVLVTALGYTFIKIAVDRAFADLAVREGWAYDQWVRVLITRYPGYRGNLEGIQQFLEGNPRPPAFTLADPQGRVVLARDETFIGKTLSRQELAGGIPIDLPDGTRWTLIPATRPPPPNPLHERFMRGVDYALWTAGGVVAVIGLVLAWFLLRHLTGPLRNLGTAAHKIAQGDLSSRVAETGQDELGRLARSFNSMAASLEQAERSKRQMIADVAHELRTPITVLRTAMEGLEDGVIEPTAENLSAIKNKIHLTSRLIDDLQQLALADMGHLSIRREPFALGSLVSDITAMVGPELEDRGIELSLSALGDLPPVLGDRQRIQQVLLNLLSNAIRHTPAGGEILITAQVQEDSMIRASVCDSGPGITRGDESRIFERFYRGAQARAEGTGTGLGLSVAKAIVEAHGGRIWAENRPTGGACFHFTLPQAAVA